MKKWPWIIYGLFLTFVVLGALGDIFTKDSDLRMYYTVLIAFNKRYIPFLTLNIISLLLALLAPLVVFLYAFDIKSSIKFWKMFFWVRIVFDLIGHYYDSQTIKAGFFQSFSYGLACLGVFIIPILPSYLAHYLYAFKKNPQT